MSVIRLVFTCSILFVAGHGRVRHRWQRWTANNRTIMSDHDRRLDLVGEIDLEHAVTNEVSDEGANVVAERGRSPGYHPRGEVPRPNDRHAIWSHDRLVRLRSFDVAAEIARRHVDDHRPGPHRFDRRVRNE